MIQHFPLEVIVEILIKTDCKSALKCEQLSRWMREISKDHETSIWKPKFYLLLKDEYDSFSPLEHESFKHLCRIYMGWNVHFPKLKQEHLSLCLDPSELSLSPPCPQRILHSDGSFLTPKRSLLAARIGLGSTTLPVSYRDEFQLWLDNSGQITRGISIKNGIEDHIIPLNRPLGSRIDMVSQVRSNLLSCIEYIRDDPFSTIYVWDPFLYQHGPWDILSIKSHSPWDKPKGLWKFTRQYKNAKPILCGKYLLVCTDFCSCRLYQLETSSFRIVWDLGFDNDQEIHQMIMNEKLVILSMTTGDDSHHVFILSIETGSILKKVSIPTNISSSSSFQISLTRFHVLIYNSENLCILDWKQESHQVLKLPFMGKPVRLDVAHDDSLIVIAPKYQRGEIMMIDILNSKIRILTLSDGYAEGPRSFSGGNVGRMSGIWLIYSDNMMNDKGIMRYRHLKVAWKKLL